MRRHWNYFNYLLHHKYFVCRAGRYIGSSPVRLILHDLSKLPPSEW